MLEESNRGNRLWRDNHLVLVAFVLSLLSVFGFLWLDEGAVIAQSASTVSFHLEGHVANVLGGGKLGQTGLGKEGASGSERKGKTPETGSADESREKAKAKKNGAPAQKNGGPGVGKGPARPERFGDPCLLNPNLPVCEKPQ